MIWKSAGEFSVTFLSAVLRTFYYDVIARPVYDDMLQACNGFGVLLWVLDEIVYKWFEH